METLRKQAEATRSKLLQAIEGLHEEQLNRKPSATSWSIAQVVQHIATVQLGSTQLVSLGLVQEPTFEQRDIPLAMILDRTQKISAPERLHPTTEPKSMEQLKQILDESQAKYLAVLNEIEDPSLLHRTAPNYPHPVFGMLSTGQWLEAAPLHEARHIDQIEEIKGLLLQ